MFAEQFDLHIIDWLIFQSMGLRENDPPLSAWDEIDAQQNSHVADYNVFHERIENEVFA